LDDRKSVEATKHAIYSTKVSSRTDEVRKPSGKWIIRVYREISSNTAVVVMVVLAAVSSVVL